MPFFEECILELVWKTLLWGRYFLNGKTLLSGGYCLNYFGRTLLSGGYYFNSFWRTLLWWEVLLKLFWKTLLWGGITWIILEGLSLIGVLLELFWKVLTLFGYCLNYFGRLFFEEGIPWIILKALLKNHQHHFLLQILPLSEMSLHEMPCGMPRCLLKRFSIMGWLWKGGDEV